jgi:hypothetical protein
MSKELEKKIADLEKRVKELETQPRENHYHYYPPVCVQPYQPSYPTFEPYRITCGDSLDAFWFSGTSGELH